MKNLILVMLATLFMACVEPLKSKEEIIQENITLELRRSMKDPDSFEFVSMEITETFTVKQRKEIITKDVIDDLRKIGKRIDITDFLICVEREFSFLSKQTDNDKEAIYFVDFSARGKNSFGVIVKNDYSATILNDKGSSILSLK